MIARRPVAALAPLLELPAWSVWGVAVLSVLALWSAVEVASLPARVALLACGAWLFFRALHGHLEQYFDRPAAYLSTAMLLVFLVLAVFAPEFSPQNPYDLAQLSIMDGRLPPGSQSSEGPMVFRLGTDEQGRDIYSGILYGLRVSLTVSLVATFVAMAIGVFVGMYAAWAGGRVETVLMRLVDLQLSFPSILVARFSRRCACLPSKISQVGSPMVLRGRMAGLGQIAFLGGGGLSGLIAAGLSPNAMDIAHRVLDGDAKG